MYGRMPNRGTCFLKEKTKRQIMQKRRATPVIWLRSAYYSKCIYIITIAKNKEKQKDSRETDAKILPVLRFWRIGRLFCRFYGALTVFGHTRSNAAFSALLRVPGTVRLDYGCTRCRVCGICESRWNRARCHTADNKRQGPWVCNRNSVY